MSGTVDTGLLRGDLDSTSELFAKFSDTVQAGCQILALRRMCGCWRVNLAQGVLVLPCAAHQPAVLAVIGETAT